MTAGLTLLSLFTGGAGFAAATPGAGTNPLTVVGGGGSNYEFYGSAPVGQTTALGQQFGLEWTTTNGTAIAEFPWTVNVHANSLTSLTWESAEAGIGTYTGPGTGVWGPSWFQTSELYSSENTEWLGDFIDEPVGTETLNMTDSGNWVPGNYQIATQYVYGNYPWSDSPAAAYWLVGTTSS